MATSTVRPWHAALALCFCSLPAQAQPPGGGQAVSVSPPKDAVYEWSTVANQGTFLIILFAVMLAIAGLHGTRAMFALPQMKEFWQDWTLYPESGGRTGSYGERGPNAMARGVKSVLLTMASPGSTYQSFEFASCKTRRPATTPRYCFS